MSAEEEGKSGGPKRAPPAPPNITVHWGTLRL